MCSVPWKSGRSWNDGTSASTTGLTVPAFPLLSASPAMTAPGWFWLGGWFSPMLSVSSLAEYETRICEMSKPETLMAFWNAARTADHGVEDVGVVG